MNNDKWAKCDHIKHGRKNIYDVRSLTLIYSSWEVYGLHLHWYKKLSGYRQETIKISWSLRYRYVMSH